MLNHRLIVQQGLNRNEINAIEDLHKMLGKLFVNIGNMPSADVIARREEINNLIEEIEFLMQDYWKFGRDPNHHTWWYRNDVCTCPKMDNNDVLGTSYSYHNSTCPLHGDHNG